MLEKVYYVTKTMSAEFYKTTVVSAVLQARLTRQEEDNEKERHRLEDLIARMESQNRDQLRQLEEVICEFILLARHVYFMEAQRGQKFNLMN